MTGGAGDRPAVVGRSGDGLATGQADYTLKGLGRCRGSLMELFVKDKVLGAGKLLSADRATVGHLVPSQPEQWAIVELNH